MNDTPKIKTPSMDEKHIPSPPNNTTEEYERKKALGINVFSKTTVQYSEDFLTGA